jgi:hypothetical protein
MTSIERWPIVPRTMLMPFLLARNLFPSRRRNSELSAGKANVSAIRVMLSEAVQRNVKHEAWLSNISDYFISQVEII